MPAFSSNHQLLSRACVLPLPPTFFLFAYFPPFPLSRSLSLPLAPSLPLSPSPSPSPSPAVSVTVSASVTVSVSLSFLLCFAYTSFRVVFRIMCSAFLRRPCHFTYVILSSFLHSLLPVIVCSAIVLAIYLCRYLFLAYLVIPFVPSYFLCIVVSFLSCLFFRSCCVYLLRLWAKMM